MGDLNKLNYVGWHYPHYSSKGRGKQRYLEIPSSKSSKKKPHKSASIQKTSYSLFKTARLLFSVHYGSHMVYGRETLKVSSLHRGAVGKSGNTKGTRSNLVGIIFPSGSGWNRVTKGQLISKCPFGVIVLIKIPTKNLTNFCPRI